MMQNFPRGGKKLGIKRSADVPLKENLKPKKRKTEKKKRNKNVIEEETNFTASIADRLCRAMLHEGLVILSRISHISEYDLKLSLPGGLLGCMKATDLSQSYTNLLQDIVNSKEVQSNEFKPLPDLFKPGDYVTCCVKTWNYVATDCQETWICGLSMDPQLINQNIRINDLTVGTKIICTIKSIEDHGYAIDTGIDNVRAFIITKDVEKGKQYCNQLLCAVKKVDTIDNTSIIKLTTKKKYIDNVNQHDVSLNVLIPGTKLLLRVAKVLSNGLQVAYGENNIGYINQIYLNNPLYTYTEDMEIIGTLLYILPTVKLAYFSQLTETPEKEKLHVGEIIEKAKVLYRESGGIIVKLSNSGLRGYISLRKTNIKYNHISTEFKEGSTHKCRILAYDWMEQLYICTKDEKILKQKYFSSFDVNIGDILTVTIKNIESSRGYINVQVGRIRGIVPQEHICDPNNLYKLKVDDSVEARVLDKNDDKNQVKFTLKQSLIKSKLPILYDFDKAKCGLKYHGTISIINRNGLLVRFYGTVKGWVPRTTLDSDTYNMNWNFFIGQTVTVQVKSVEKDKRKMKLTVVTEEEEKQSVNFSIGEMVEGTVMESSIKGVHLRIQKENDDGVMGFLPAGHMAPCLEIGKLLASRCVPGDVISAFVFATKPAIILSRTFVTQEEYRNFDTLKVGDCIPCTIQDISQDGVRVVLPIENYSKLGFVSYKNISNFEELYINQILFTKITAINKRQKHLSLTMSLKDVWDVSSDYEVKMMEAVDILSLYFSKLSELAKSSFYENRPISSVTLGEKVTGIVKKITEHGLILQLKNNLIGTVHKDHCYNNPQIGEEVFGTILWKNYVHELVDVSLIPRIVNGISSKQKVLPELPTGTTLKAEILMITKWFILVLVKRNGIGYLAALPVRRYANDNSPDLTPYKIQAKIRLYVIMKRDETDVVPICMLKSTFETPKSTIVTESSSVKNKQLGKKRLSDESSANLLEQTPKKVPVSKIPKKDLKTALKKAKKKENIQENKMELAHEMEESRIKDIDEDSELNEDDFDAAEAEEHKLAKRLRVPECGFHWDDQVKLISSSNVETSSDEEEKPEEDPKQKKKKLSAAERREQERQKEREIRQREEALANNQTPNSVDQFDRLILSNPDNSLLWAKYVVYHVQATEIDKARAVIRRAIKTINFRDENERLNMWKMWLTLESKYGNAESRNDVFQEALKTNDAYKIYEHMLIMHAVSDRKAELEKLVNIIISKFKQNPETWISCGGALLKIKMKEKSRQIMQRALQSLPASEHVNLLVRFANLEDKWGDEERAHTLFENILTSYPKRVDVWSNYVDSLIKCGKIDLARKVLERACVQTLPPRKMKTLFTKFINFEERHGTSETVTRVRQMATDYVEKHTHN